MVDYPYSVGRSEPFELFGDWYGEAQRLDIKEPTAMTVATATPDGRPSARTLLLKAYDDRGFCFYTNLTSRKGKELKDNPHVSLLFYWMPLGRQIRIEGAVERVSEKEADDYFASRRRGSQIGAWASKQSLAMDRDEALRDRVAEVAGQFEGGPIPRPPFWSGFRLVPEYFEFWEEGEYRLHKRITYVREGSGWVVSRIYP